MKSFEVFFTDLTPDAQRRYLEFQGVQTFEELNCDILPIAIIDKDESE